MIGEHTALDSHVCAACGAKTEWNPARQWLVCPFCGTRAPAELDRDGGGIREHDLVQALHDIPDEQRGWGETRHSVSCRSCQAVSVFEPTRVGQTCDFCGSPELLDYDETRAPIRPESLLPFRVEQSRIREGLRHWFGSRWFAPSRLKRQAMIDTVRGLYIPYWTFDARVRCPWSAEAGTYYYRNRKYRDRQGRQQTRRERHVRWRPASGEIEHFFDDQPVPGTQGIDRELLTRVEPFPMGELVAYDTAYVSGFVVEHYKVVLVDAYRRARESMDRRLHELCAARVPGDTYRNLTIAPQLSGQTFKHVLVPVWLLTYRFGRRGFQVVANGYTGEIAGHYPRSFWKILLLILAAAVAAGLLIVFLR